MPKFESTLFTSIPPRMIRPVQGREFGSIWHAACIESWREAGFRVISLNSPQEIEALRSFASAVEFREIPKGRTRPLITDFFSAISRSESKIVGIINADCMMIPKIGIAKHLTDHLDGLVIAERLNLNEETLKLTHMNHGFDAFFFEAAAAATIVRDDHWRIGDLWYDYWLPLAFNVAGFEIKTLPVPILLHLNHHSTYSAPWEKDFPRLINLLRNHGSGRLDPNLAAELLRAQEPRVKDVHKLTNLLFIWLRSHETLWHPEVGSLDDLMTRLLKNVVATLPYPSHNRYRDLLGRIIDTLGLRRTLYMLGLVGPRARWPS
jgi:hypothetical protein